MRGELEFVHTRTIKLSEEVLNVKYNYAFEEKQKLMVAVATLDNTIRVYHEDSLKLFLNLYGHSLPVLSVDISDDNTLLVSGSADKLVKIWGLDFGDCHRSLLGHTDSIMKVQFQPKTHYFFSASKDKTIRYWNADNFTQIMILRGHIVSIDLSKCGPC